MLPEEERRDPIKIDDIVELVLLLLYDMVMGIIILLYINHKIDIKQTPPQIIR